MILEYKNYVSNDLVEEIQRTVLPFIGQKKETTYNRDGFTVNITELSSSNESLVSLDHKLSLVIADLASDIVGKRFKPQFNSGDSGYEYHLYRPGDICHYHSDGEVCSKHGVLRYATVILFLTDNDDGELVFPAQNVEVKPEKRKIVIFPPYGLFSHYSKPSVKDREILMTWFIYDGIKVNAT